MFIDKLRLNEFLSKIELHTKHNYLLNIYGVKYKKYQRIILQKHKIGTKSCNKKLNEYFSF